MSDTRNTSANQPEERDLTPDEIAELAERLLREQLADLLEPVHQNTAPRATA